jgi:hypothetical protein
MVSKASRAAVAAIILTTALLVAACGAGISVDVTVTGSLAASAGQSELDFTTVSTNSPDASDAVCVAGQTGGNWEWNQFVDSSADYQVSVSITGYNGPGTYSLTGVAGLTGGTSVIVNVESTGVNGAFADGQSGTVTISGDGSTATLSVLYGGAQDAIKGTVSCS